MTKSMKRIHSVRIRKLRDDGEPITETLGVVWENYGIRADAEVSIGRNWNPDSGYLIQQITSGGLWGIDADEDSAYLKEIEEEQLSELREQLHAIGFSNRAISSAFKDVKREN